MTAPRLFLIGGSLLLLNAAAVLTTGVWRHVVAAEPPTTVKSTTATDLSTVEPADGSAGAATGDSVRDASGDSAERKVDGPSEAPASSNPLDRIPIPDSLPSVPSLADHESLKDDPGFQEFSRLFSKVEESWELDYPASVKPQSKVQSAAYYESLDKRLHSAEQLCAVARCIAAEAGRQALSGRSKQSEELLQMATQLRDMAAKLLVAEL